MSSKIKTCIQKLNSVALKVSRNRNLNTPQLIFAVVYNIKISFRNTALYEVGNYYNTTECQLCLLLGVT